MEFKLWSELNPDAKIFLKPDLGLRPWDILKYDEKVAIWDHLEIHFFDKKPEYDYRNYFQEYVNDNKMYYPFFQPNEDEKRNHISSSIAKMYHLYKVKGYTKNYLIKKTHFNTHTDFYEIFVGEKSNVVFELLSLYCRSLIDTIEKRYFRMRDNTESPEDFAKSEKDWQIEQFNEFANALNEVFLDFGINIYLSYNGFIPRQDEKITRLIYEPVIISLADPKWIEVNKLLAEAFAEYRQNTPQGFSGCVTHTVSAIQAFLQILVLGKTGSGDISKLITQAQIEELIPSDMFTKDIFRTIESVLMKERQMTGDAHPKKEYATEKNAKTVLNLSMIFIQHCLVG